MYCVVKTGYYRHSTHTNFLNTSSYSYIMALGVFEVSLFTNFPVIERYYELLLHYVGSKILVSLAILSVFYIISKIFLYGTEKIVLVFTQKTKTKVDDEMVEQCRGPISMILLMVGVKLSLLPFNLTGTIDMVFSKITTSFMLLFLTVIIKRAVGILIEHWGHAWAKKTHSSIDDALVPLFHKMSNIGFWLIGIMFILSLWGIDIRGLLAGVGVAGVAIGFAVKDSLGNIFGGVSLILDRAIKVGDVIKLSTNEEGTVVDVGLRSTRIRTWDNELILIPNGQLANTTFHNYKLPDLSGRVVIPVHVGYGSKPDKVKKVLLESVKGIKGLVKGNKERAPQVRFVEMADFSLHFKLYLWTDDVSIRYLIKEIATNKIYNALNKHKIDIPFPTQTLYVKKTK